MALRAVTFDFWETLVQDTSENLRRGRELRLEGVGRVLASAGLGVGAAALDAAYETSGEELTRRFWSRRRDPSIEEQVAIFLAHVAPGLPRALAAGDFAAAVEAYSFPVLHVPPRVLPGAREAVEALAARGLTLGIVSNTGRTPGRVLRQVLAREGLLAHFHAPAISYSDEVGVRKPDGEIFARTLAALGVAPDEALHVGDNPVDDVDGARAAGMRTAHYAADGRQLGDLASRAAAATAVSSATSRADLVVGSLGELPDRLARLGDSAA